MEELNLIPPTIIGGISGYKINVSDEDWFRLNPQKKKVCVVADYYDFNDPNLINADVKVFLQVEPKQFNRTSSVIPHKDLFDIILTHENDILNVCENAIPFSWGDCWIVEDEQKVHEKTKLFSIIASFKNSTSGQMLRHQVIGLNNPKLDVYGENFIKLGPEKHKIDGTKDYAFNVVLENEPWEYYFTEKLIDCLRTGSIPIYRGCTNIHEFFDTRGFYLVNSLDEINHLLNTLTIDDYNSKLEYVHKNFELAEQYTRLYKRVDKVISDYIELKYFS